ncbi:MAG: L-threonylcarbamoyladenylate synthase, partial [Terracidiphilus sp.]
MAEGAAKGDNERVKTQRWMVDSAHLETAEAQEALECGARILRSGGLVALPTETVYGLGADALNAHAVERIFAAKQRPAWDPIIVHVAGARGAEAMLATLVHQVPDRARRLIEAFWPGPLTLLLPRSAAVPDVVTAGRPLVGLRMPSHPVALELIRRAGVPIAAPSANTFGHTSPTTAAHVLDDLDGRIDAVVDAGPTEHGVESTVLDPCQSPMVIYRPGAVTSVQIREIAGAVELFAGAASAETAPRPSLPAPGVGLRHYAPRARLLLTADEDGEAPRAEDALSRLETRLAQLARPLAAERVGVMLPAGVAAPAGTAAVYAWG